jgi:hypothetical protein
MTSGFDDQVLRDLLGLGPDDRVEELARAPSAVSDVGEGLSYQELSVRPGVESSLVTLARQAPLFTCVEEINSKLDSGTLERWDRDPGIFRFQGLAAIATGPVEATPGENWMIDARGGEHAVIRVPGAGGETILVGQHGELRCFRLRRVEHEDALAKSLEGFHPVVAFNVDMPTPDDLLEHMSPAEWLLERAHRLHASPAAHDRIASVGLVARLGAGTAKDPARVFEALVSGTYRSPTARALDWARGLGRDVLDVVERRALELIDALGQHIETLEDVVAEGGQAAERAVRAIRHGRDDLESIAGVLRAAQRIEVVGSALDTLDREAAAHLSAIDLARVGEDELLSSVAWQEPHAWWGEPRGS